MICRFANPSDASAISDICSRAWRVTYEEIYTPSYIEKVIEDFYNLERVEKECHNQGASWHGYMVVEEAGQVLGCIGGACEGQMGYIYVLYLAPEHKGKGLGRALLEFLTDYQKETYGITKQTVHVTADNQMGIPFYEKMGFQVQETVSNWIDELESSQLRYLRKV